MAKVPALRHADPRLCRGQVNRRLSHAHENPVGPFCHGTLPITGHPVAIGVIACCHCHRAISQHGHHCRKTNCSLTDFHFSSPKGSVFGRWSGFVSPKRNKHEPIESHYPLFGGGGHQPLGPKSGPLSLTMSRSMICSLRNACVTS